MRSVIVGLGVLILAAAGLFALGLFDDPEPEAANEATRQAMSDETGETTDSDFDVETGSKTVGEAAGEPVQTGRMAETSDNAEPDDEEEANRGEAAADPSGLATDAQRPTEP